MLINLSLTLQSYEYSNDIKVDYYKSHCQEQLFIMSDSQEELLHLTKSLKLGYSNEPLAAIMLKNI